MEYPVWFLLMPAEKQTAVLDVLTDLAERRITNDEANCMLRKYISNHAVSTLINDMITE